MSAHIRKPTKAWRSQKKHNEDTDFELLELEIVGLCRCSDCEQTYPRLLDNCPKCDKKTV